MSKQSTVKEISKEFQQRNETEEVKMKDSEVKEKVTKVIKDNGGKDKGKEERKDDTSSKENFEILVMAGSSNEEQSGKQTSVMTSLDWRHLPKARFG